MPQTSYSNNYGIAQAGLIADQRNKVIESFINGQASAIEFGRGVALGLDAETNAENFYQEVATVVYDADFISLNSIALSVNGDDITPVVFDTDQATTLALLVAAVDALDGVTCTSGALKTLTITRRVLKAETPADIVVVSTVTLGTGQAGATYTYATDQIFAGACILKQNEDGNIAVDEDLGLMTQGALWCELVTSQTPAVAGSVYVVSKGTDRGKFTTVNDTTTEAVSSAIFKSTVSIVGGVTLAKIEFNRP